MKTLTYFFPSPKKITVKLFLGLLPLLLMAMLYTGCQGTNEPDQTDAYTQKITDAWNAFTQGNYSSAYAAFNQARLSDSVKADAYLGLGWCALKLDSLKLVSGYFAAATRAGLTSADLYAGYAFLLNATKQYEQSNSYAANALVLSPNWVFAHQTSLNKNDLKLLQAQNYYQLGNFSTSLSFVQLLNSAFSADVTTAAGRLALADEIERLKSI